MPLFKEGKHATVIKKTDKLVTPTLNIGELKNELIYIRDFAS